MAQSRRLPVARVDQIGQGRVWAGTTARQIGLVDEFGSLDVAIAEAARLAGLDPAKVHPLFIEQEPNFLAKLLQGATRDRQEAAAPDAFSQVAAEPERRLTMALADARMLAEGPAMQVRCLDCPLRAMPQPVDRGLARLLLERLAAR